MALESKTVDAVLAVTRGVDLYDAIPVLVTKAKDLDQTAGSLTAEPFFSPNW